MADITINLTDEKSAVLSHNGIFLVDMQSNNYKVIAGEQLATSFELVYDKAKYADYTFTVEIVNAAGKGVIITEGTNPLTDIVDGVFFFPIGAAVQGYAKMTVTATNNSNTDQIAKWELIKIKVWETNPNWKEHIDPATYVTQAQFKLLSNKVSKKPDTLKFETEEDFKEYLRLGEMAGYPNVKTLADGTIFNIIEEGIPDYWWDATNQIAYEWEAASTGGESGATTRKIVQGSSSITQIIPSEFLSWDELSSGKYMLSIESISEENMIEPFNVEPCPKLEYYTVNNTELMCIYYSMSNREIVYIGSAAYAQPIVLNNATVLVTKAPITQ